MQNGLQARLENPALVNAPVSPAHQTAVSTKPPVPLPSESSDPPPLPSLSCATPSSPPTSSMDSAAGQKRVGTIPGAASNRVRLHYRLSAVKKNSPPQPQPPLPPPASLLPPPAAVTLALPQPTGSQPKMTSPPPALCVEDVTPVDIIEQFNEKQLSTDTGNTVDSSGIGSHPTCSMDTEPLMVRVPVPFHRGGGNDEGSSFVVSLPRRLVQAPAGTPSTGQSESCVPESMETTPPLIVSIDKQYFTLAVNDRVHPMALGEDERSSESPLEVVQTTSCATIEMLQFESFEQLSSVSSMGAPSGRLKTPSVHGIPVESVDGVDGCLGRDGVWYRWTDFIPSQDESVVSVLPYVYVDGWDFS